MGKKNLEINLGRKTQNFQKRKRRIKKLIASTSLEFDVSKLPHKLQG
jgi:hypothetical protein